MLADKRKTPSSPVVLSFMSGYDVGALTDYTLLKSTTHDTYRVETTDGAYILKIYGPDWRSSVEIDYEIDLLEHLVGKGIPVAAPVARMDGRFYSGQRTPTGQRYTVLYTYAEGNEPPWPPDPACYRPYGRALARIHTGLDDFSSAQPGPVCELGHLLDDPTETLLQFLGQHPDDANDLRALAAHLHERVSAIAADLDEGPCHGDIQGANCHATDDGTVTFFDFECCGISWRVYDLATLRWAAALNGADDTLWTAFLQGYMECRDVSDIALRAVPLFVLIRHIWWMGTQIQRRSTVDKDWDHEGFLDRGLAFLRTWQASHAPAPNSPAPLHVRPYAPTDREPLLALAPRLVIGLAPWRDPARMLAFMRQAIAEAADAAGPDAALLVAEDDQGGPLGFVSVARDRDFTGDIQAYIGELAVTEDAEGKGAGRALMRAAEEWARDRGYQLVVLDTGAANARARAFYRRLGYAEESVRLVKVLV